MDDERNGNQVPLSARRSCLAQTLRHFPARKAGSFGTRAKPASVHGLGGPTRARRACRATVLVAESAMRDSRNAPWRARARASFRASHCSLQCGPRRPAAAVFAEPARRSLGSARTGRQARKSRRRQLAQVAQIHKSANLIFQNPHLKCRKLIIKLTKLTLFSARTTVYFWCVCSCVCALCDNN